MEIEERAKLMGWVPQEDFKGDPDRWTDAKTYVDRADSLMPIMKSQNKKYEKQLQETNDVLKTTQAELQSLKKTLDNVVRVNTKVSEREYDRAMETIRKEQAKAIEDQDGDRFKELEKDKDKLIENKPEKIEASATPAPVDENPVFNEWVKKNAWYNEDTELRNYSDYMASIVAKENPYMAGEELFETVKSRVKATFPDKFENPNRQQASVVDGGTSQGSDNDSDKKKTYRDLPKEAKDVCDNLVSEIEGYTREDYVREYFEEA